MRISGFLRIFAVFPGFLRISADFNFLSQFFIFIFCKKIYIFFFYFWVFLLKSAQKKLSQFSKIPKVNVLGRISGFFRFYPDLSGFIRILISCPNFFLKKDNIFFVKNLYFFLLFLGFSAKITKNLVPIFENSQGQCPRRFFGISAFFRIYPEKSGFFISCPNF